MTVDHLFPNMELLSEEYVLIQAWKKTSTYIRYHNWYSDTLELDRVEANIPHFLANLAEQLKSPGQWNNDPLRIVPAPKSQTWRVKSKRWEPEGTHESNAKVKLRPLAHVSIKDQVAASAVMLCLADQVETLQGDPRDSIDDAARRRQIISYGNRLFCDLVDGRLRHRWGSGRLYRAYFDDYKAFLSRPQTVAEGVEKDDQTRVVIIHSDLAQFYDRVRPQLLAQKIDTLKRSNGQSSFFDFAHCLLNWEWDKRDLRQVTQYAKQAELSDFSRVALPQGLVASGFFANIALLDFDQGVRENLQKEIAPGISLLDFCRYVDDLRIVLSVNGDIDLLEIEDLVSEWLDGLLNNHAEGLKSKKDKTLATIFGGDERPLVRQSRKMDRVQGAIYGGFDAIGGKAILDSIQGLIRSQQRYSAERIKEQGWPFSPIPDARDETVARFAAWRYRNTYRSLRPLLSNEDSQPNKNNNDLGDMNVDTSRVPLTQSELDDEAKAFALGLIEHWVEDPSNVRLLRIGLDIWPANDVLRLVLGLLRPLIDGPRKPRRLVALYCLSEVFRVAATETGFVEDSEALPQGVDIEAYRSTLRDEAIRLASLPPKSLPWYLRQQVLLFLSVGDVKQATAGPMVRTSETRHYHKLIRFLRGEGNIMNGADFATLAILSRRSFAEKDKAVKLALDGISARRLNRIAEMDPSFAVEILESRPELSKSLSPRLRDDLCWGSRVASCGWERLSDVVLQGGPTGRLRNELAMLRFALIFLKDLQASRRLEAITPCDVLLKLSREEDSIVKVEEVKIVGSQIAPENSFYHPPSWCPDDERWRFQLGYLLRFILTARQDFTSCVRPSHWKEDRAIYRPASSHWYQRLYGLCNMQSDFGDDWLPISEYTERLLTDLLAWPGRRAAGQAKWISSGINDTLQRINDRIQFLAEKQGCLSNVFMLPLIAERPEKAKEARPLRVCVAQTVIPTPHDIFESADLCVSCRSIRKRHRNHLSAALAAIERMLDLRETHAEHQRRLDWLILPELSVHPLDVRTHLIPFARANRTIILAGLTYEELFLGKPLVNSAIWVIPKLSEGGLQVVTRRQGKRHLTRLEERFDLQGFRPCQWLIGYDWSHSEYDRPLWLTASICFDATDLRLAADLRDHSDVFAIPALNKDVNTFDQMSLALHYHMFQMVVVANNGLYGGSNAYAPYKEPFHKQVFHLHGQPQASVAFFEIDDIEAFIARTGGAGPMTLIDADTDGGGKPAREWKSPPAGMK